MLLNIFQILLIQLIITFPIIIFSKKIGLLDIPDQRKLHLDPTPYTGGIIISITLLFIVFVTNYDNQYLNQILSFSVLIAITGLIDDKYNVNPGTKIVLQFFPIFFLINNGFYLTDLGSYESFGTLTLGSFDKVFTIFCCLLMINAFNYSDGVDGLVSSIIVIILISFNLYLIFLQNGISDNYLILISLPFMIFLIFNFGLIKNFKIFLGDSGSNLVGFLISFVSIYMYNVNGLHPSLIIWPLAYIVFEFLSVNIIRLINNKKIFKAGKDHLHYELSELFNLKKNWVLLIILLINIFYCVVGCIMFIFFKNYISIVIYFVSFMIFLFLKIKIKNMINYSKPLT